MTNPVAATRQAIKEVEVATSVNSSQATAKTEASRLIAGFHIRRMPENTRWICQRKNGQVADAMSVLMFFGARQEGKDLICPADWRVKALPEGIHSFCDPQGQVRIFTRKNQRSGEVHVLLPCKLEWELKEDRGEFFTRCALRDELGPVFQSEWRRQYGNPGLNSLNEHNQNLCLEELQKAVPSYQPT